MYENNYPNNYNNNVSNSTVNSTADHTYRYENTNMGSSPNMAAPKPPKKNKSDFGFGKKILVGICCGLCFGIFAGLGFQAVDTATDLLKTTTGIDKMIESSRTQSRATDEDINEDAEEVEETPSDEEVQQAMNDSNAIAETPITQATVTDVTQVVKDVMPSVVSINNKYVETMSFWGQDYSNEAMSTGSGIIVGKNDTELLLVSNYHVVASAEELTVQFVDGSQIQAQIKGTDEDRDLAVIAVQLDDIEAATMDEIAIAQLGDSTALTVGEPVIAIGNAMGYGQSVTTGVVSALNRPIANLSANQQTTTDDVAVRNFIQTDAAINPGNSGGALLNTRGEVIGINSNKIGGTVVEGMGYAIPISDAKPIIEELMTQETKMQVDEARKGYLGITGVDVVAEYSELYDMPQGVYVSSVFEGTAADEAGLVKGDIITGINGIEITTMDELKKELGYHEAGEDVEITYMQALPGEYQSKTITVTLGVQANMN